eukprot:6916797-Alexandrium_andersonii.AAC.1
MRGEFLATPAEDCRRGLPGASYVAKLRSVASSTAQACKAGVLPAALRGLRWVLDPHAPQAVSRRA